MSDRIDPKAGLNPGLKARDETTHDTTRSTPPPAESASVTRHDRGRGWSAAWLVVAVVCLVIALWILFF